MSPTLSFSGSTVQIVDEGAVVPSKVRLYMRLLGGSRLTKWKKAMKEKERCLNFL